VSATTFASFLCRAAAIAALWTALGAQDACAQIPGEFHGTWVPATAACDSATKLEVAVDKLTLVNGADKESFGDIGIPASFFGPEYSGISVVAVPGINGPTQPFTLFFNADEKKGETRIDIYQDMGDTSGNPQLDAVQTAAKKLADRFPALNRTTLKKCPA